MTIPRSTYGLNELQFSLRLQKVKATGFRSALILKYTYNFYFKSQKEDDGTQQTKKFMLNKLNI